MIEIRFLPMGDQAVHLIIGHEINPKTHQQVMKIGHLLQKHPLPEITEWVPTYQAITLFYRPELITYNQLVTKLKTWLDQATMELPKLKTRKIDIPVLYGEPYGPDLDHVAKVNHLDPEEVIAIHTQPTYLVYMIGFTPGFPYLGGLSPQIATPRKKNPRPQVPAGSIGIADQQTGIYSLSTPGGWNLIGRTPIRLFDPQREPAALLTPGDQIRFVSIHMEEYKEIEAAWKEQTYEIPMKVVNLDDENH